MAAYTQKQLDAIRAAYASGVTSVWYEGKRTEYRSLAEMRQIIATIEADLERAAGRRKPSSATAVFRRS